MIWPAIRKGISLLLLCTALLHGNLPAQHNYLFNTKKLTVKDGLAHQEVYDIFQDSRSFIWMGTRSGLSRYNGYTFTNFTREKDGLPQNSIHSIAEDRQGRLWLFSLKFTPRRNSVVAIDLFDIRTHQVVPFSTAFPNSPFAINEVQHFFSMTDRQIAFFARNRLWIYSGAAGFTEVNTGPGRIPAGGAGANAIWATETGRYLKLDLQGRVLAKIDLDSAGKNFPAWLGEDFIYIIHPGKQLAQLYHTSQGARPALPAQIRLDGITHLTANLSEPVIWAGGKKALRAYAANGKTIFTLDNSQEDIFNRAIRKIFIDKQGLTWVATEAGVFMIEAKKDRFTRYLYTDKKTGSDPNLVQCRGILQVGQELYVGTYRGLFSISLAGNSQYSIPRLTDNGAEFGIRFSVLGGTGDTLMLGARLPVFMSRLRRRELGFVKGVQRTIWCMHRTRSGQLLLGSDKGLQVYDKNQSDTVFSFRNYNRFSDFMESFVIQITTDRQGNTWMVTDKGLYLFDEEKGITAHFGAAEKGKQKLPADNLQHLYQDAEGIYWLCTGNAGLIRWNRQSGEQTRYGKAEGLSSNNIYALYEDNRGYLWMSSDYGIMRFQKSNAQVTLYLPEDGLSHYEFNRISHHQAPDGRIFFGSLNGLTAFYPESFYDSSLTGPNTVMISGYQQYLGKEGNLSDLTGDLMLTNRIVLNPSDRFFSLTLAVPDYMNTAKTVYYYKVEGVDKDWIKSSRNEIQIGRLPYGRHQLRIRAQMPNGNLSSELGIELVVKRPWYLQWWFYVLAVLLIGLAVRYFYQWRIRQLQIRKKELELIVEERTLELKEDKALIEKQAEELKQLDEMKTRFFSNVAHELRTPLTLLAGPVNRLMQTADALPAQKPYLQIMDQHVRQLSRKVNEILDFSKLDAGKLELKAEALAPAGFLEQLAAPYREACRQKNISFNCHTAIEPQAFFLLDPDKTANILNNLLSNAFKFTPAGGQIDCSVARDGEWLVFLVKDTGPGIPAGEQANIFKRYYQVKNETAGSGGTGIGLAFARELVQLMNGRISVTSQPGAGAEFRIMLPARPASAPADQAAQPEWLGQDAGTEADAPMANLSQEKATILLVEDHPGLQQFISLELEPHRVLIANHGAEGLALLRNNPGLIQLVISDLMMPVMDGFSFIEQMKKQEEWQRIPVIVLTARTSQADKLTALRTGVDDYITKPFLTEELTARVNNLLLRYRQRREWTQETDTENPAAPLPSAWLLELEAKVRARLANKALFTIDDIAADMYISTRQLQRNIRAETGLTLNNYIREMRLHQARLLLEQRSFVTMAEYSYAVGFNDPHYFSKLFTDRYGKKPADYLV